jgi:hypothetical protein
MCGKVCGFEQNPATHGNDEQNEEAPNHADFSSEIRRPDEESESF